MAVQSGIGFSKVLLLVGAGFTGSIVLRNGRLSEILGELQTLLKGLDKSGDPTNTDSDYSDAIATQVRRLAMEVRQLASARSITVVNGTSSQMGGLASLAMPAAAMGALGYGYIWWKGLSFSDLMYVTKSSMANAVSSMTKHLGEVSNALATAKRHLTQRIENLDGKLDEQKDISKSIKEEVNNVRGDLYNIGFDLEALQQMVCGLDGKIGTLEDKQDYANVGVYYLCHFVGAQNPKMAEFLQGMPKPRNKHGFLKNIEKKGVKCLLEIAETLKSGTTDMCETDPTVQNNINSFDNSRRNLFRSPSIKC
eukprot:TRINITY_DN182_c0_g1_i1.p1 TRINITY_DN182_c0_g1~~TRINITY_DN182_c0_g1_i1.p1  ORF type:complete len:309 (+),score=45.34 TRINITY_DN182_c0_g1_i1:131-1057(+)